MTGNITYLDESAAAGWERTLYAFLAEKERRSGSKRTVQSYSRMLHDFFGRTGKTPDEVTSADVFAWGYGRGLSGREPSSITIGARVACLSSFYRFLIRMKVVTSNPCDALERPKATQSTPRGLSAEQIRRLLAVVPRTPVGLRDRAIILTLVMTGRRRAEVLGMTAGSISVEDRVYYTYRGKGGKTGKRELPQPAYDAITGWLAASGRRSRAMAPDALALAGHADRARHHQRHLLHEPPALPEAGRTCHSAACTSSATARRSSGGMPASRSRRCRGSWTTAAWR